MLLSYTDQTGSDIDSLSTQHIADTAPALHDQLRRLAFKLWGKQDTVAAISHLGGTTKMANGARSINPTDDELDLFLWQNYLMGNQLNSSGVERLGLMGKKAKSILRSDTSFDSLELFKPEVLTPEGKELLKRISHIEKALEIPSTSVAKNNLMPRAKSRIEYVLEVARLLDPMYEHISLGNFFNTALTQVYGSHSIKDKKYISATNVPKTAPFRVNTTHESVFIGVVPYSIDNANLNTIINEFGPVDSWKTSEGATPINHKLLVFGQPSLNGTQKRQVLEKNGIQAITFNDLEDLTRQASKKLSEKEPKFFGVSSKEDIFAKNLAGRLRKFDPTLTENDVKLRPINKELGNLSELEMKLMFKIISKYDPGMERIDGLKNYFPSGIIDVAFNDQQDKVAISSDQSNTGVIYADMRVMPDFGESVMVDVKRYTQLIPSSVKKIINHYGPVTEWSDGTPITEKIILFNSNVQDLDRFMPDFEEAGIKVITYDMVEKSYKQSLTELVSKDTLDHKFFRDNRVPMYGSSEEVVDKMMRIKYLVGKKPNRLQSIIMDATREYATELLSSAIDQLDNKQISFNIGRKESDAIVKDVTIPMSEVLKLYHPSVLELLENNTLDLSHFFFYDFEANDKIVTRRPLINTGGYGTLKDGELQIRRYFAKDPLDEPYVLKAMQEEVEGKTFMVGFNSEVYDKPLARGNMTGHLMPFEMKQHHIDIYLALLPVKNKNGWNNGKLQTFERRILNKGDSIRVGDIPSADIPKVHHDFMFGSGDYEAMQSIIHHNILDIATTALLTLYAHQNDLLKPYVDLTPYEQPKLELAYNPITLPNKESTLVVPSSSSK